MKGVLDGRGGRRRDAEREISSPGGVPESEKKESQEDMAC